MITSDYHVHTSLSADSEAPMEEMAEAAIQQGLDELCITEHMDYDYTIPDGDGAAFVVNTEACQKKLEQLQQRYAGRLRLLFGVELGMQPHLSARYKAYVRSHPFDFVLASSHVAGGLDPFYPEYFAGRSEEEGYRIYFETILENVNVFDDFDVYGHLDYVVRYGPNQAGNYTYEKYRDVLDAILETLIKKGKGIELNTAGLKYGLPQMHPHEDIVRRYHEMGGRIITIGSDAHRPEHVAYRFDRAAELLRVCGFNSHTVFRGRKAFEMPL